MVDIYSVKIKQNHLVTNLIKTGCKKNTIRAHARTHACTLHAHCIIHSMKTGTAAISWNITSHDGDDFGNEDKDEAEVKGHINLDTVQTVDLTDQQTQKIHRWSSIHKQEYPVVLMVLISSPGNKC